MLETVFTTPTAVVVAADAVNIVGAATISDTSPTEGALLTATVTDADGIAPLAVTHQWQVGDIGMTFTDIAGATGESFNPAQAQVGKYLRVMSTYTDNAGNLEQVLSAPTTVVGDQVIGTPDPDALSGTVGDDDLQGLASNDVLIGGGGGDMMTGGLGHDTYEVTDAGDVVVENAGEGIDTVWTSLSSYILSANVENLMFGGAGNFSGIGNILDNMIVARGGNDTLIGGGGADTMTGGTGDDTYEVTDAGDVVTENAGEGGDTIWTSLSSYTLGATVENLHFGGVGSFSGTGNDLTNRI
ncbi:MAG: peroxidase family protein, partial [bacterium]